MQKGDETQNFDAECEVLGSSVPSLLLLTCRSTTNLTPKSSNLNLQIAHKALAENRHGVHRPFEAREARARVGKFLTRSLYTTK